MSFVNGYLAVMAGESEETKQLMLAHLQERMEDRMHMDGLWYCCTMWPGSNT